MPKTRLTANERKKIVTGLIANSDFWTDKDRDALMGLSTKKLVGLYEQTLVTNAVKEKVASGEMENPLAEIAGKELADDDQNVTPTTNSDPTLLDSIPDLSGVKGGIVINQVNEGGKTKYRILVDGQPYKPAAPTSNTSTPNSVSEEEWLRNAPAFVRNQFERMKKFENETKTALVEQIVANESNRFNKDWLMSQDLELLQGMAAIAGTPEVTHSAPPMLMPQYVGGGLPTANRAADISDDDVLPLPTLNFEQSSKKVS